MQIFVALTRFLSELTLKYGVIGLAIGTGLESFGVPVAAVVLDLTAGILILSGRTTFLEALIVADSGLVLGSLAAYYVGRGGARIFERWHRHPPDEAERRSRSKKMIERYGDKSIFFAQLFGPARTWISYPAGAMGMDVKKFTVYTALGGAIYCSAMIAVSLYFTNIISERLSQFIGWITLPVIVGLVLGVLLLLGLRIRLRAKFAETRKLRGVKTKDHTDGD